MISSKLQELLEKWQAILCLLDWDICIEVILTEWHETSDVKIDVHNKKAILMVNYDNPHDELLEHIVLYELLRLKLGVADALEATIEDLTKAFLSLAGQEKELSSGQVYALRAKQSN